MPPVTPTSTVRSPAGAVGVWPLTLRSVRGLVLDLVVDDLLEGDGEEVGAARVDERRRQLLDAHRVLAEAVVVAVDLPHAGGSPYALVMIAAKRARQINSYYHSLGENTMGIEQLTPPLINTRSTNLLTISFEEIVDNKIEYQTPD